MLLGACVDGRTTLESSTLWSRFDVSICRDVYPIFYYCSGGLIELPSCSDVAAAWDGSILDTILGLWPSEPSFALYYVR
jgi:hypothetical protein